LVNSRNLAAAVAILWCAATASGADFLVYVGASNYAGTSNDGGTSKGGASRGIYGYRFDPRNGRLKALGLMASTPDATSLVEHPDHRFLYAVSGDSTGGVSAFLVDPKKGKLSVVNQISSQGARPCHLDLDRSGRWLAVANCGGESAALFPLRKDGGLAEPRLLALPHSHPVCVQFSPDNHFLLVADQGMDRIWVYRFDADTGNLTPADPPFTALAPGAGVGHLVFHSNGRLVYAVNQTRPGVTAYHFNPASGSLDEFQAISTVPSSSTASHSAAEIRLNATGSMVYACNQGSDTMVLLTVDPVRSTLSVLEFTPLVGRKPRSFALDPTGAYMVVANQESNNLSVYTVHPRSGQLRPVGRPTATIEQPSSLVFVPVQ
jgi:6-phosphogluconolactonase